MECVSVPTIPKIEKQADNNVYYVIFCVVFIYGNKNINNVVFLELRLSLYIEFFIQLMNIYGNLVIRNMFLCS